MDLTPRTTRPHELSPAEREAFTDALYEAHCDVFDGVDRAAFAAYVVDSKAERTEIRSFHTPEGEVAGYVAMHFFDRVLDGQDTVVIRAEAGMKRAFRGANKVGPFMAGQIVQQAVQDDRPALYMGSLVHPSSFCALTRHAPSFWPNPFGETPPEVLDFMVGLAEDFHLDSVDPARPLVRQVGWITRDTPAENAFWRRSTRPLARFFVEQNPGFDQGHGLVTLIPMGRAALAQGVSAWGKRALGRKLSRMGAGWRRLTGQAPLTLAEAGDKLSASPAFRGVSRDVVDALLAAGTQRELPAGTVLFRRGDPGRSMFVILDGSCFVLVEEGEGSEAEQVVVDQLDRGHGFGELALVSGEARSATVRAAIDTVVLEIDREALLALTEAHLGLAEVLWHNVGRFRFDELVRGQGPFADLDRVQRQAWWDRGTAFSLAGGENWQTPAAGHVVLFDGSATRQDPAWAHLAAPSIVPCRRGETWTAHGRARIAWLPPVPAEFSSGR
ncbi:MAG: cyclic nucleotide-binding domain-containing protein [Alphaproteobacteria bacterium]|nr:cyclic nucleotide-binding domain-containing protein [Alphaproteobacteria bacterium]